MRSFINFKKVISLIIFFIFPTHFFLNFHILDNQTQRNVIYRVSRRENILSEIYHYRNSLREDSDNKSLLDKLKSKLNVKDSRKSLIAAMVLVENRFVSEEKRLEAIRIIKENYEVFFKRPLNYEGMVDFHIHTFYSDAYPSPSEVVLNAWLQGMKAVSVVNHNTFDGVLEAMKAGEVLGIKVVPGIEIDVEDKELGIENLHVLAYFDKGDSQDFLDWLKDVENNTVKQSIDNLYKMFKENGSRMIEGFNNKKFKAEDNSNEVLTLQERDYINKGEMIVRARLAEALIEKYGFDRLIGEDEQLEQNQSEVSFIMHKYFNREQGTYFGRPSLPFKEISEFIVSQGGIIVVAHPTEADKDYGIDTLGQLLEKYARIVVNDKSYLGIRGVEVYSSKTPLDKRDVYIDMINELNENNKTYSKYPLMLTVGSDGHRHFDDEKAKTNKIPVIQEYSGLTLENLLMQIKIATNIAENKPIVVNKGEIEILLRQYLSRIKVVVLDMDETLTEHSHEPVSSEIINKITALANKGIKVAIVTGASEKRVQENLFEHFPESFKNYNNIHVYAHFGSVGYSLDVNSDIDTDNPYYELKFTEHQQQVIDEIIEVFLDEYGDDIEEVIKYDAKRHIGLCRGKERTSKQVEEYVQFLIKELEKRNESNIIISYGGGLWGLDIKVTDKSNAINDLISNRVSGISEKNIMVVADSFSGPGDDRAMNLSGVLVFNVGSHENVPQDIYSLEKKGPAGTLELLIILNGLLD